jgi:mannose-6-phosphate isomerase-like protein (cupin superfamily)
VGYTVLRELEFTAPSGGDKSRGIARLSDAMTNVRANVWRYPPGTRGRRHAEQVQEEVFVVLDGIATLALGEPPEHVELPRGAIVVVEPRTPLQVRNDGTEDAVVLILGAPPDRSQAEYLPDAD